jgi:hypothetical protein
MKIIWHRDEGRFICDNTEFRVTCDVRNELNGRRKLHDRLEVVHAIATGNPPYMPRPFPKGKWRITGIENTDNPVYAPVKIKTDA